MSLKLYELTGQVAALDSMPLDNQDDIGAYAELYHSLSESIADKAQAVCMVIRNANAEAEAIQAEIDRLTARKRSCQNRIGCLKTYLQSNMENLGIDKIKAVIFSVWIQGNPESVDVLCPAENLPDEYKRVTTEPSIMAIKKALQSGAKIDGCNLLKSWSIRIK